MKTVKFLMPKSLLIVLVYSVGFISCQKSLSSENQKVPDPNSLSAQKENGHLKQAKTYSSEVITKWLNMQLDMMRVPLPPGTGSQNAERSISYLGITAYEAVLPGMPAYQSLSGQLTDFPKMPETEPGKAYHWAAAANAALASINRKLFPTTSNANKDAMDQLEGMLQSKYAAETDPATLERSINFGREVANRVGIWAATDGFANINPPYVPPAGPGLWVPTSPAPAPIVNPYASQRRLLVPGVANGTALEPPPPYSEVPGSAFWNMVKDVYDWSFITTADQKAAAVYNRDAPGYPGGGHFISILSQVIEKVQPKLDAAAIACVKMGLAQSDATNICFSNKYQFNLVRPVTYIRNVMGHTSWSTYIPTPNHPEFPSGHATINSSVMTMMENVFGENFQVTLHTYDYLGLPPRSFNSFQQLSIEMANSRVWGGIHYQATCDKSLAQGKRVAENILNTVKFLKE